MKSLARKKFLCLSLLLVSALLFSCVPQEVSPLPWNRGELSFLGSYEENGVTFTAHFSVSATAATTVLDGRSATVTLISPSSVEGITYRLDGDGYSVERDGERVLLSLCPAPIASLLLFFPTDATLGHVESTGDGRTETVLAADGTYVYVYTAEGERPTSVTKDDGIFHRSLTVIAWE